MNRLILFILFLFILSCKKDEYVPCNCSATQGILCREYRYQNDEYIGYIDYQYNKKNDLIKKSFFSPNNSISIAIRYEYSSGKLKKETHFDSKQEIKKYIDFQYTSFDSIQSIVQYENNTTTLSQFEYNTLNQREKKSIYENQQLKSFATYQYTSDNMIWKISYFNADSALASYELYEFFGNNFQRIEYYNNKHEFLGYNVIQYTASKQITRINRYNYSLVLTTYSAYEYTDDLLIKVSSFDDKGNTISYTLYEYS